MTGHDSTRRDVDPVPTGFRARGAARECETRGVRRRDSDSDGDGDGGGRGRTNRNGRPWSR